MSNTLTTGASRRASERLAGKVVLPQHGRWEEARQAWNLAVDQRPAGVALPESAADVRAAVRLARDHGLRVAAQGTGHGAAALGALEDTLLVRTAQLREVSIDAERRRARVGAGVIWEDVVAPATALGLTALHGSSPDVGVAGYTLGGGIGWLARRYGLAANSVTAVELVTADAEHVRTDAEHEPELFWGLRGGGGNFGVVTALEFALYPVEHAYAGWLIWPWEQAERVLGRWVDWTRQVPDTITSLGRILRLPPAPFIPAPLRGRDLVVVEAAYLGDEQRGSELLRPLRDLGPELDTFATIPAAGLARLHQDPEGPTPAVGRGGLLATLPAEGIESFLTVAGPDSASPLVSAEIRHLGGALATPAPEAGALSHLDAAFAHFAIGIAADTDAAHAARRQVDLVTDALAPWAAGHSYLNFAEKAAEGLTFFPHASRARLGDLRARVDPDGIFRANQEIRPT